METKEFKSLSGDTRISMTSGHCTIVGTEWGDLSKLFWQEAYALGCVSKDMIVSAESARHPQVNQSLENRAVKKDELKSIIGRWVENNEYKNFTTKGKPKSNALTATIGRQVNNTERDEAWSEMEQDGMSAPVEDTEIIEEI